MNKKVLFTATVDSHILHFHIPYLKMFKEKGYEVHIATGENGDIPYCDKKHIISISRSPYSLKNLKGIMELKKIIDNEKFDIIHCHTPMGSVVTRFAAKKARREGTRVIYTAHGFHFYKGAPILNWFLFYPIEKYLSKYTDTIITINKEDYELAKKKFIKTNVEYIPGVGVDPKKFDFEVTDQEKRELRAEIGCGENDHIIVCVGELNENKNQIMIINAMKEIIKHDSKARLILVGEGKLRNYYEKVIISEKLDSAVKLLGYRKDVNKLLKISDLLVSCSKREGLPVNLIEGVMCGLPIVATNCRGNADIANEYGYLVNLNDQDELVESITRAIYRDSLEIKKDFVNEFYLESILKKMNEIYEKKKIVIHLLASNKYSGAENVAITIIRDLQKKYKNFKFVYVCTNGPIEGILKKENIDYDFIEKVNIKNIEEIIKKYNPDIIHAHDFRASVVTSFCNFKGKLISHLHNNAPWLRKHGIYSLMYYISSHKYNKILLVSDSIKREYVFSKWIMDKFETIGNPIDAERIKRLSEEKQEINRRYDLIFVGRLSPEKNPLRFIEIVNMLKQIKINVNACIIGDGILRDACLNKIKEYGIEENITMMGFLENPFPYILNSDCLCITSDWEGYGLVAVEAMLLNVPVLGTPVGGLVDILNNGYGKACYSDKEFIDGVLNIQSLAKKKNISSSLEEYSYNINKIYE